MKLLSGFLIDRIVEKWSEYGHICNTVKLISVSETIFENIDRVKIDLEPNTCRDLLIDKVTLFRLNLVKWNLEREQQSRLALAKAIMPILKHLLDDPNISIRRTAVECLSLVGRAALVDGSVGSPLPVRHRLLLNLIQ
jgi:hypothetical protein